MRPLVMDNNDTNVYDIKNQWMFEVRLLIAIRLKLLYKAHQYVRFFYLPKLRGWYDLYTNRYYADWTVDRSPNAPYDRIPVFITRRFNNFI